MSPEQLTEWRTAKGLTPTQLANLLGVTYRAVHYWERGERQIPPTVEKLLELLKGN